MSLTDARSPEPHARARATPLTIALNVELSPPLLEQIRAELPAARLIAKGELKERPEALALADILFTQHGDPRGIAHATNLRWVQTYGSGVEWLLTDAIVARDELRITNARGIHAQPIAEHVFGLILAFTRRIDGSVLQQQARAWQPAALTGSLRTLEGATLGILGLGAIGRRIADLGKAFGMRVIGTRHSAQPTPNVDQTYAPDGLLRVLAESDYIVNALPATAETEALFDREAFTAARTGAVFVNIGRGTTVDTDALVAALRAGKLAGALLDVTAPEPLPKEHELWQLPGVIITPHYAGAHPGYAERVTEIFVTNLRRYLRGEPLLNLVNKRAGY